MNDHGIAVLIFAHSGLAEARHKKIALGPNLFETLTEHTLREVKRSGLPHFHFTEKEQIGRSFGERFTHAVRSVVEKGYAGVICIGNDTPGLGQEALKQAAHALHSNRAVLGPSADGGFYLLGIRKGWFDLDALIGLPWQKASMADFTKQLLADAGISCLELDRLRDIDSNATFRALLKNSYTLGHRLVRLLLDFVVLLPASFQVVFTPYTPVFVQIPCNKGSPKRK